MDIAECRQVLLEHFDRTRRDLPWRRTSDAYAIWVSEVMLQQTRVDTVIPYYERFLERFPTVQALADATEDEVLSYWSGLGYYSRARRLQSGVREVVTRYGGEVPADPAALRALPGVGRYTAGAIASIAFARPEPVVDGNVARVLSRLQGIDTPAGAKETERRLWMEAEALVRGPRPGDLNQALMEFGATVCLPRNPLCGRCPLSHHCVAYIEERIEELPPPKPRAAIPRARLVAIVATADKGRRVALVRERAQLFGGLWGLPTVEGEKRGDAPAEERARAHLGECALSARLRSAPICTIEHVLSHRRLEVQVLRATHASLRQGASIDEVRLATASELKTFGVSRLTHRILAQALPAFGGG